MNKTEFLKKLKEALSMRVEEDTIRDQLEYYDKYIETEIKNGKSEKEVIDELGDPFLIAKTISTVNTVGKTNSYSGDTSDNSYSDTDTNNKSSKKARRMYQPYVSDTGIIGCAIAFLVLFIIIMGLLRFFGYLAYGVGALALSGPIGFMIVILLIFLLFGRGRR